MPKKKAQISKSNSALATEYLAEEINLSPIKKAETVKTPEEKPVRVRRAKTTKATPKAKVVKAKRAKKVADPAKIAAAKKKLAASILKREKSIERSIKSLNNKKAKLKIAQSKLRKLK